MFLEFQFAFKYTGKMLFCFSRDIIFLEMDNNSISDMFYSMRSELEVSISLNMFCGEWKKLYQKLIQNSNSFTCLTLDLSQLMEQWLQPFFQVSWCSYCLAMVLSSLVVQSHLQEASGQWRWSKSTLENVNYGKCYSY